MPPTEQPDETGWDEARYIEEYHLLQVQLKHVQAAASTSKDLASLNFKEIAERELEARKKVKELERENAKLLKELAKALSDRALANLQQTVIDLQEGL